MKGAKEMLKKYCPDGVQFKLLQDVCTIQKGTQLNKEKLKPEGLYPVINGGIAPSGYWDEFNFPAQLITISQGGASAGYVNYILTPFWAGAHCYVISECSEEVLYRYVYHFLKLHQQHFQQKQVGAGIPSLALKELKELKIPVPPLTVQKEIVRILDTFTDMETVLREELDARQKQYEFYRDKLLTFNEAEGGNT